MGFNISLAEGINLDLAATCIKYPPTGSQPDSTTGDERIKILGPQHKITTSIHISHDLHFSAGMIPNYSSVLVTHCTQIKIIKKKNLESSVFDIFVFFFA